MKSQVFVYFCILFGILLMLFENNCRCGAKINSDKIVLINILDFLKSIRASVSLKALFVKSSKQIVLDMGSYQ